MGRLVCILHPKYEGKESPVLSCKTCCGIFVAQIRAKQSANFDAARWMAEKAAEARGYNPNK
jgi:hypothetical protein